MLFRVSGRLTNNTPFTMRLEAPTIIGAISTGRSTLNENGAPDEAISEIRARRAVGGKSVRFGNPNSPKRTRKPATNGTNGTNGTEAATPVKAPAVEGTVAHNEAPPTASAPATGGKKAATAGAAAK